MSIYIRQSRVVLGLILVILCTMISTGNVTSNQYAAEPRQFIGPLAVTTDSLGNVFVADTGNDRVQNSQTGEALSGNGSRG